jgi:hypothetical protein
MTSGRQAYQETKKALSEDPPLGELTLYGYGFMGSIPHSTAEAQRHKIGNVRVLPLTQPRHKEPVEAGHRFHHETGVVGRVVVVEFVLLPNRLDGVEPSQTLKDHLHAALRETPALEVKGDLNNVTVDMRVHPVERLKPLFRVAFCSHRGDGLDFDPEAIIIITKQGEYVE